jgi:hypothetical protein
MKRIMLVLASILLLTGNVIANTWVNHSYSVDDWGIIQEMSYNGYNECRASLTVYPSNFEDYLETATTGTFFPEWEMETVLSYGLNNYCNVTLNAFGNIIDLNLSINYTQQGSGGGYFNGTSTTYGPYPSEYSEGEGWYTYDVRSSNHADYTSNCGDTFTCVVDVINNTDNSTLYIQVISGYFDCLAVPPYSFTLLYDGVSIHNSNSTFYPLGIIPGPYEGTLIFEFQSNITIPQLTSCIPGFSHSCYIEIYNDTDNSIFYVGNLSAIDDGCSGVSFYKLPDGSFGTLPPLNGTGGISINNGTLKNMPCTGFCIIGLNKEQFQLYAAVMIIILVLISIKPFKLGATASAFALLFFNNIMGWTAITSSLMLIFVFIALAAWWLEGKL